MRRRHLEYAGTGTVKGDEIQRRNARAIVQRLRTAARLGYAAEDKETQLRITLRWRLMGGNKKGHRVATAAPTGGIPLYARDTHCRRRCRRVGGIGETPLPLRALSSVLRFFSQRGLALASLRARSVISASRLAGPRCAAGDQAVS